MTAMSDYLENELLDHALGTGAFTSPGTVYVSLYTSDPTDADSGTEVSAGGYARQSAAFDAAASGSSSNTADVEFGPATASWGTVTHVAIHDADTAGNLLFHGSLSASKTIATDDSLKIAAGNLSITFD